MQAVVKPHFSGGCWAMQGQPVLAPTCRGMRWFGQWVKDEKVGEKLCLVMWDSQPSLCGCGQARPFSGRPELGGYLFNFYFYLLFILW